MRKGPNGDVVAQELLCNPLCCEGYPEVFGNQLDGFLRAYVVVKFDRRYTSNSSLVHESVVNDRIRLTREDDPAHFAKV